MKANITRSFETFPGFVYFVKNEESGLIKIGWTGRNVFDRVEEISRASGCEILVIGAMYGSKKDEKAIHNALKSSKDASEWFRQTNEVFECLVDIFANKPVVLKAETILA